MSSRRVVIGVGNPMRRDDGAGLAVLERLAATSLGTATPDLVALDGEPTRVLDAWDGAALAVVVDAAHTGVLAGTVHRCEIAADGRVAWRGSGGSHALGIGEAVALAGALDRLPSRLIVYGIEGETFDDGEGLSAAVTRAVGEVAAMIAADVIVSAAEETP